MNREYDAFEVLPDGTLMWRATVIGHEDTVNKLKEVAKGNMNEFRLMHVQTKTVIATINAKVDLRPRQESGPSLLFALDAGRFLLTGFFFGFFSAARIASAARLSFSYNDRSSG